MPDSTGKRTFDELNQDGCNYGWIWMHVNEAAVTVAAKYGLRPYDPENKVRIMAIVLAVLDKLNQQGVLKLTARDVKDYIMQSPTFLEREINAKDKPSS